MLNVITRKHLRYEIWMLAQCYRRLRSIDLTDRVLTQAFIEAFCVHARNLFEFFTTGLKKGGAPKYARGFKIDQQRYKTELRLLNDQISHLTNRSFVAGEHQIDQHVMSSMYLCLGEEIDRFRLALDDKSLLALVPKLSTARALPSTRRLVTTADVEVYSVDITGKAHRC